MLDLQAFSVVQGDERIRTAVGFRRIDVSRFNPGGARGVRVRHVYLAVLVAARTLDRLTERGTVPGRPRSVSLWGAA